MQLFLIPGKKFDQGRFQSRARQPLLSRKRVSRNQQNNAINCNFRQASKLEPKTYLFFSKSLSFIGLFKILRLLGNSKRETRMALQKILQKSVKFGGNVAFLCDLAHSLMTNAKQDKIICLF